MTELSIVVDAKSAQNCRKLLEEKYIWDDKRRLKKVDDGKVAIPVKVKNSSSPFQFLQTILSDLDINGKVSDSIKLPSSKKENLVTPYQALLSSLKTLRQKKGVILCEGDLKEVPNAWERHGDLLLLPEGAFQSSIWMKLAIGDELWRCVAECMSCSRVAQRGTIASDGFRTPQVKMLLGSSGWVEHLDNGVRYTYDVTKCMFSAGNITEKLRVAGFNCSGETVVDLYAGIGYFTLPYLVHAGAEHVHACEWNPNSTEALRNNLNINQVSDRCTIHFGDNRQVCPKDVADRVNLGLIPSSEPGWQTACAALRPQGGILHIHGNVTSKHSSEKYLTLHQSDPLIKENKMNEDVKHFDVQTDVQSSDNSDVIHSSDKAQLTTLQSSNLSTNITEVSEHSKKVSSDNVSFKSKCWSQWADGIGSKISEICSELRGHPWKVEVLHIEHVKSYAPFVDHLVLDLSCHPYQDSKD